MAATSKVTAAQRVRAQQTKQPQVNQKRQQRQQQEQQQQQQQQQEQQKTTEQGEQPKAGPPVAALPEVNNPVGKLQEFSQKQFGPLPQYTFECTGSDPTTGQFVCTVRLQDTSARGTGKSKRLAKQHAASVLLRRLQSAATTTSTTTSPVPSPTPTTTPTKKTATTPTTAPLEEAEFQRLSVSKRLQSAARAGAEVGGLFCGLRNRKGGAALPPIEGPAPAGASRSVSACDQLVELGRLHRFGVQFLAQEERPDKSHRCVVKLSTMPTVIVVGNGTSAAACREQACFAALEYLALMTKETQQLASAVVAAKK